MGILLFMVGYSIGWWYFKKKNCDGLIMVHTQNFANYTAKKIGKDNFDIATLLSIIGSTGLIPYMLLISGSPVSINYFSVMAVVLSAVVLLLSLRIINLGRSLFKNNGEEQLINLLSMLRLIFFRRMFACWVPGAVLGSILTGGNRLMLYIAVVLAVVSYLSSCKPAQKSKVKLLKKLFSREVSTELAPSAAS